MTLKERKQLDNNLTSYVEPLKKFDNGTVLVGFDRMRNMFIIDNAVIKFRVTVAYQVKNERLALSYLFKDDLQLSEEVTKEIADYLSTVTV